MKLVVLVVFIVLFFVRYFILTPSKRNILYLSLLIQFMVFPYPFLNLYLLPTPKGEMIGAFGDSLTIEYSLLISFIFIFIFMKLNFKKVIHTLHFNKIFFIFLGFVCISLINPFNHYKLAVLSPVFVMVQLIILLSLLKNNLNIKTIFLGIFDGLKIVTFIQLAFVILFPILNQEFVLQLFFPGDEGAAFWAFRREGYPSALGTFVHPGNLALFVTLSGIFFLECFFRNIKRRLSMLLFLFNFVILFFTFSRSGLTAFIVSAFILTITRDKFFFTEKNFLVIIFSMLAISITLIFSPVYDLFFNSDSNEMIAARLAHYQFVLEFLDISKWIGVGLNTHVNYMLNYFASSLDFNFLLSNPIHNIHFIILVETGILGLLFWLYFFVTRIKRNLEFNASLSLYSLIINRVFAGMLISYFIYGNTGWAGGTKQIFALIVLFGFFSKVVPKKQLR